MFLIVSKDSHTHTHTHTHHPVPFTLDAIMRTMLKRMNDEFNLIKAKVPIGIDENDTTSPQAHILLSYVESTVPSTVDMLTSS